MYEIDYPRLSRQQVLSLIKVIDYMKDEKGDFDSPFITEEDKENHIQNDVLILDGYVETYDMKGLLKITTIKGM